MLNTEPQPLSPVAPVPSAEMLVRLSDAAAGKLRELTAEETNPAIGLRVYVYSGGCSGYRYGMMLEDQPTTEDVTVESNGVRVYVDQASTQYLTGSEIDYVDTLMGAGFTVNNPNAVTPAAAAAASGRRSRRAARAAAATDPSGGRTAHRTRGAGFDRSTTRVAGTEPAARSNSPLLSGHEWHRATATLRHVMELPLFPLHTVLCPGVALPLHVFEERYRRMVERCVESGGPFGVVLIREGRETGPLDGRISRIGTTAVIREVGRLPDGRFDLMTVGGRRFRIETLTDSEEPYLIADVRYLREPVGDQGMARMLAGRVSSRFLRYLEALQPALEDDEDGGPEYEVEVIVDDDPEGVGAASSASSTLPAGGATSQEDPGAEGREEADDRPPDRIVAGNDADRRELLMAAARRLVEPEDPTALSYVLSGLIQVELPSRQRLLEAATTELRLRRLEGLLGREIDLLHRDLKPLVVDARGTTGRKN